MKNALQKYWNSRGRFGDKQSQLKNTIEEYTFEKCTLKKYTFEKYTLIEYTIENAKKYWNCIDFVSKLKKINIFQYYA